MARDVTPKETQEARLVPVPRTADDKVDVRALCRVFDEAENGTEAQR